MNFNEQPKCLATCRRRRLPDCHAPQLLGVGYFIATQPTEYDTLDVEVSDMLQGLALTRAFWPGRRRGRGVS